VRFLKNSHKPEIGNCCVRTNPLPPSMFKSRFFIYISPHKLNITQKTCNLALTETCITKKVRMILVLFEFRHSEPTDFEFIVIWCHNYTAVSFSLWAMLWLRLAVSARVHLQASSCTVCGGRSGIGSVFCAYFSPPPHQFHPAKARYRSFFYHWCHTVLTVDSGITTHNCTDRYVSEAIILMEENSF